jgi:hypothetical protein
MATAARRNIVVFPKVEVDPKAGYRLGESHLPFMGSDSMNAFSTPRKCAIGREPQKVTDELLR